MKKITMLIEKIKELESFDYQTFQDLIEKYGKENIYQVFKKLLETKDKNELDELREKYSLVYIAILIDGKDCSDEKITQIISTFGKENFIDYFINLLENSKDQDSVLKQYNNIFIWIQKYYETKEVALEEDALQDNSIQDCNSGREFKPLTREEEIFYFNKLNELKNQISIGTFKDHCFFFINTIQVILSVTTDDQIKKLSTIASYLTSQEDEQKLINQFVRIWKKINTKQGNNIPAIDILKNILNIDIYNIEPISKTTIDQQFNYIKNYFEIRKKINMANQGLVRTILYRYYQSYFTNSFDDLYAEGNIGLMKAIELFDPMRSKFSTYACFWIISIINRYLCNLHYPIRTPVNIEESIMQYSKASVKLTSLLGRDPTDQEIAEYLNWDIAKVLKLKVFYDLKRLCSLDAPLETDKGSGGVTLHGIITDSVDLEETVLDKIAGEELYEHLNLLNDRDRTVLILRFGLNGEEEQTLEQIGHTLGITRERVRQIEKAALSELKIIINSSSDSPVRQRKCSKKKTL